MLRVRRRHTAYVVEDDDPGEAERANMAHIALDALLALVSLVSPIALHEPN